MTFCSPSGPFASSFAGTTFPRLISACRVEHSHTQLPRLLHSHRDRLELLLINRGRGLHIINGEPFETTQGDVLVFEGGVLHDEKADLDTDMEVYCLAVADLRLPGLAPNRLLAPGTRPVIPAGEAFPEIASLFEMVYRHTQVKGPRSDETVNYLLRALVLRIEALSRDGRGHGQATDSLTAARIKEFLDSHYDQELDLATVAAHLGVTSFHVAHVFKAALGLSPMQYLTRRRIGEAQSMLIGTRWEVGRIATEVGFNNISHFHHVFVRIVGLTPGRYRLRWVGSDEAGARNHNPPALFEEFAGSAPQLR